MTDNGVYILNPHYDLRTDKKRAIITNRTTDPIVNSFIGFVHPVYAIILSFFDGERNLSEVIGDVSTLLKKERNVISNIIHPLLENDEERHFHFDDHHFSFPKKLLTRRLNTDNPKKYNPRDFFIHKEDMDLKSWRLNYPLDILFMVNTQCATDCIYCYADRRKNVSPISFERLKDIMREAKELNLRSIDITGGELFLKADWETLLRELLSNGFMPYISTKCPISPDIIEKLKDMGIDKIQISIDSINKNEMMEILNVDEKYYHMMMKTFNNLDARGIAIYTNTQLMSINTKHIGELIDFLLSLENIKRINMGAAGYSIYKGEERFLKYKPSLEAVKKVEQHVNELKEIYKDKIAINFSGYQDKHSILDKDLEEKKKAFDKRARCSANFYSFVLLPDGKVTICEELYWHPAFIIGDLKTQSIEEVWNSKRALEIYNISRDMVRDESPCKNCAEFEPCHRFNGVCWKEVIYAYGYDNWDYADPKCPHSTMPKNEYYL